ncbi:hypothetical protein ACFWA5_49345 [Streptomyces mirabilis]|uniref:hypothetical protein n=1 Tax=Streptomyces mirabilis TaxID=68239 RepID=UPI003653BE2C
MKKMTTSPRWRVALASAGSAAVLVAAPLVGAQTAHAQYPPPPPRLTLSRTTLPAGGALTFVGTGFGARQLVTASLFSNEVVLGRYRATRTGVVTGKVTIPRHVVLGSHTFKLTARHPDLTLSAGISVQGRLGRPGSEPGGSSNHHHRPDLAETGNEKALALGGTAAGLIAAGGGTMLAVRRRRSS